MTQETAIALRAYTACRYEGDREESQLAEFVVNLVTGHPSQLRCGTPEQLVTIEDAKSRLRAASRG